MKQTFDNVKEKVIFYIAMLIARLLYITVLIVVVAGPSAASNAEVAANENKFR